MRRAWMMAAALTLATATACGDDGGSSATPGGVTFDAHDLVTGARYTALVVEIDWMTDRRPTTGTMSRVEGTVNDLVQGGYLGKPDGVRYVLDDEIPASGDASKVYSFSELDALVGAHRDVEPASGEAGIYILFVDGGYEDDEGASFVLGFAYGGSAIVMLADNVERACGTGLPLLRQRLCDMTTATVMVHELGHLFGLVNNGVDMVADHQDEAHGAHDVNEDCVMYWQVHGSSAANLLGERLTGGDETILPFNQACLDDLMAAQAP